MGNILGRLARLLAGLYTAPSIAPQPDTPEIITSSVGLGTHFTAILIKFVEEFPIEIQIAIWEKTIEGTRFPPKEVLEMASSGDVDMDASYMLEILGFPASFIRDPSFVSTTRRF